jgi:hypothetical protein
MLLTRVESSPAIPAWGASLARRMRALAMSPAERELLETLERASERSGRPLLEAADASNLEQRLETVVVDPEFHRFNSEALRRFPFGDLELLAEDLSPPPEALVEAIGAGPAKVVSEAMPLAGACVSVLAQALVELGRQRFIAEASTIADDPMRLYANPHLHSRVKAGVLEGALSSAAFLGIAHAVFSKRKPEPWLALALAERYRNGLREYLRVLASLEEVSVPKELMPPNERLDMRALQREVDEANERIERLADQALTEPDGRLTLSEVPDDGP